MTGAQDENAQRANVVRIARTWLGTPYRPLGRVRGSGCDCATFPAEVYAAAGVIAPIAIGHYPPDWHLHQGGERYLARVLEVAREVAAPQTGDFVLYRMGRALAHGAIVIAWPRIVHAAWNIGVVEDDGTAPALTYDRRAGRRERRFYSCWGSA